MGIKKTLVLATFLLINACVIPSGPREKYIQPVSDNSDEFAVIHVYRVSSFFGAANDIDILVDGKIAGEIGNGDSLSVLVIPGRHTIAPYDWTSPAQAPVYTYNRIGNPIEHDFQAGDEYYIRWKPGSIKEPNVDMFQFTNETMHDERR